MKVKTVDEFASKVAEKNDKQAWAAEPSLVSVHDAPAQDLGSEVKPADEQEVSSGKHEAMSQDRNTSIEKVGSADPSEASLLHVSMDVYERAKPIIIGTVSVLFGLMLWHLATEYNFNYFINFESIPGPVGVGSAFLAQLADSEFYIHILVSMKRILFAYSIAVVLGIGIGLVIGRSRNLRAAVSPYIEIIRPIPAVAWIPLAILMWPTEESSIIYITFLGALFPIILNTVHGVEQTPEVLVRAALSLGAKRSVVFRHVVFPSALPSISAGLAIGMGVSWFSLLAGEIISGQYGIGYFTWNAYSLINYPDIVVGMLVIGGLGSLSTFLVRLSMRRSLRWKHSQR